MRGKEYASACRRKIPFSRQTAAALGALEGAANFAEEYAQYPGQDKTKLPVKRKTLRGLLQKSDP